MKPNLPDKLFTIISNGLMLFSCLTFLAGIVACFIAFAELVDKIIP